MGIFKRLGRIFRGSAGIFVKNMEERNPAALLEDIRNQIDKVRKEAEQQIIEIQTNAELISMEMKNEEKQLEEIKKRVQSARNQGNKEVLVELLMLEEMHETTCEAYRNTYSNSMEEVKQIKEDFKSFEHEMNMKINELRSLKSRSRAAALKENLSSINSAYVPGNDKIRSINESMERVRDIVNKKIARANAVRYLNSENPETKMRRFEMESAKDAARAKAEKMLEDK